MVVPSFNIGVLGRAIFDIGFVDGILVIIFFNLLGVLALGFFSTLGPAFGLRQMIISRLWCGWYGAKICMTPQTLTRYSWHSFTNKPQSRC